MYMTPRGGRVAHTKFIPQLRESLVRCPSPPAPPLSPLLQPTQRGSTIMARRMRLMCSFWGRHRTGRGCHSLDMLLRCMCKPFPVSTVKYQFFFDCRACHRIIWARLAGSKRHLGSIHILACSGTILEYHDSGKSYCESQVSPLVSSLTPRFLDDPSPSIP